MIQQNTAKQCDSMFVVPTTKAKSLYIICDVCMLILHYIPYIYIYIYIHVLSFSYAHMTVLYVESDVICQPQPVGSLLLAQNA